MQSKMRTFLKEQNLDCLLFIGDTLCDLDMYYLSHFLATDRLTLLASETVSLLVSSMEYGRALKESSTDEVVSTSNYGMREKLKALGRPEDAYLEVLKEFLRDSGVMRIGVAARFPAGIYESLRKEFGISIVEGPVSRWRAAKSEKEIKAIRQVQLACGVAMRQAIDLISRANPRGEHLYLEDIPLTSERVRGAIEVSLLERGCEAVDTIVAGGKISADPHARGEGPLPANAPIVIDIFPRSKSTRYFADMTRTVLRGEAAPEVKEIFNAVLDAQLVGLKMVHAGVSGDAIHSRVCEVFQEHGYSQREDKGFIHSTGHGVGLEIHERPSLREGGEILETNNVVTVEPGLYYPEIGGIRLEDLVVVTVKGCDNLTAFERRLVL